MKDFDVSTITTSGAQLLAQATEGNRLVVSGCEANTTVYTAETAKAVTAPTGARISNEIELVSVQDNKIIIRARFAQSETTGGNANSLVLFGRLANDPAETRTAICVVSNNAQFYLPSSTSEAVQDFECLFTIDYEIKSNVVVEQTSALECSLAEFRLLKERTVTSHKEGDPDVGDPTQNIFGAKVFRSQIGFVAKANFTSVATFNGGIAVNGDAQFAEDATFKGNIILPDKTSDGFSAGNILIGNVKEFSPCATISQNGVSFECEEMNYYCSTSYNSDGISIYGGAAPSFTVSSKELSWSGVGQSNTSFKITDNGELFLYQKNDKTFALTATNRINEVTLTTDYVVCRKSLTTPSVVFSGGTTGEELAIAPVNDTSGAQTKDLLFENCEKLQLKNTWTGGQSETGTCEQTFGYSEQEFAITNKITVGETVVDGELTFSGSNLYGKYSVDNAAAIPASIGDSSNPWDAIYCKESVIVKNGGTKNLSTCVESLSGSIGELSLSKIDETSSSIDVRDLVFQENGAGVAARLPAGLTLLFIMSSSSSDIRLNAGDDLGAAVSNNSITFSNTMNGYNLGSANLNNTITILLSSVYLKAGDSARHPVLVWIKKMGT